MHNNIYGQYYSKMNIYYEIKNPVNLFPSHYIKINETTRTPNFSVKIINGTSYKTNQ